LKKFETPHQQIHKVAVIIEKLKQDGQYEQAEHLVNKTRRGLLAKLISLFIELRNHVRDFQREIAVILVSDRRQFAISVDMALAIEKFSRNHRGNPTAGGNSPQWRCSPVGQPAKTKDVIETDSLMTGVDVAALSGADPIAAAGRSLSARSCPLTSRHHSRSGSKE
jgi:hypothetical protein